MSLIGGLLRRIRARKESESRRAWTQWLEACEVRILGNGALVLVSPYPCAGEMPHWVRAEVHRRISVVRPLKRMCAMRADAHLGATEAA